MGRTLQQTQGRASIPFPAPAMGIHYTQWIYRIPLNVFCLLLLILSNTTTSVGQDTLMKHDQFNKRRFTGVMVAGVSAYGITMAGLNEAWYRNNARSSFHFFDDHNQWQQIDKIGHFYSSYHLSYTNARIYKWTGIKRNKAIWMGALTGIAMMIPIEIQDGFSKEYGASWSDMLANTAGAALALQGLWWDQPRIHPKFSFHRTSFAALRPNTLGDNLPQQMLKDYNGQTYWLSFDIQSWMGNQSKFPKWINLALGYGANNMIYANKNINQANGYDTYRQYYLSVDVNFTRIQVRNKFVKSFLFLLNTLHIPAPALEFNKKGMTFHPLYF
jgi:uncharacterized protein YfiM (DUF2279 family)